MFTALSSEFLFKLLLNVFLWCPSDFSVFHMTFLKSSVVKLWSLASTFPKRQTLHVHPVDIVQNWNNIQINSHCHLSYRLMGFCYPRDLRWSNDFKDSIVLLNIQHAFLNFCMILRLFKRGIYSYWTSKESFHDETLCSYTINICMAATTKYKSTLWRKSSLRCEADLVQTEVSWLDGSLWIQYS